MVTLWFEDPSDPWVFDATGAATKVFSSLLRNLRLDARLPSSTRAISTQHAYAIRSSAGPRTRAALRWTSNQVEGASLWKPGRSLLLPGLLLLAFGALPAIAADLPPPETLRVWVEEMKAAERGPFENIRWFCKDGSVLPPKPYACAKHGGGIQHGDWNARARAMRDGGYLIANVLAGIDPQRFTGPDAELDALRQILLERFLISWDDGWVLRAARSYRGALQSEDEEAGARALVLALLADAEWRSPNRFMLLREAVRLLPLQADEVSASHVRVLAMQVAEDDARLPSAAHQDPQPARAGRRRSGPRVRQGAREAGHGRALRGAGRLHRRPLRAGRGRRSAPRTRLHASTTRIS